MSDHQFTSVPVLLGRGQDGHDLFLDLADPAHVLIQGMTRSGKSSAVYTLLGQVIGRADIAIVGVDLTGLVLGPIVDAANVRHDMPNANILRATGGDAERAINVLAGLVGVMDDRIGALRGLRVDQVRRFSASVPLMVVLLEEWPGTVALVRTQDDAHGRRGADRLAPQLEHAVLRLVAEGAKVGVRVVLVAQRAEAAWLTGYVRAQFGVRLTLRVEDATSVAMLHGAVPDALLNQVVGFRPGQALLESPEVVRQVVLADHTPYSAFLAAVDSAQAPGWAARAEGESAAAGIRACLLGHSIPEGAEDRG